MPELPAGWVQCAVSDVFDSFGGGTPNRGTASYWNGKIPWLSSGDIKSDRIETASEFISRAGLENSTAHLCRAGSVVIVVRSGVLKHTLPVAILANEAAINQDIKCFDAGDDVLNRWFLLYLKARAKDILSQNREGTTVQSVKYDTLLDIELPIPPEKEQRRIVAKLEELVSKVDVCKKRMDRIPSILKRFRKSVLAAACSGKLTADLRRDGSSDEELPAGWQRTPLVELVPKGGLFDGPFGSNLKSSDYVESGVRVIRLENIGQLRFIGEKESYISRAKYETLKRHTVASGDIIFSSFISEEIRACILPRLQTKAVAKADCFCIRPDTSKIDARYLVLQLVSSESYQSLVENVHGVTRPRINTRQLRQLEIRVCSLSEQVEIVRRVEALFKLIDQIESRYNVAKVGVDQLTRSILAKAFRGELVPQDAKDEPAAKLLERVKGKESARALAATRA